MAQNLPGNGNRYGARSTEERGMSQGGMQGGTHGGGSPSQGGMSQGGMQGGMSRGGMSRGGMSRGGTTRSDWSGQERRERAYGARYPGGYTSDLDEGRFQTASREDMGERMGSQARPRNRGPKNWQRSDERIQDEICEHLARERDIDVSDVSVSVQQGTVTLTGTVDDRRAKHLIEDLADDCAGVRDVENRLRVREGGSRSGSGGFWAELFGFDSGSRVGDIMTREVLTVRPDDMISRAAQIMKDADVGSVPVCDGKTLHGMITDRDIAIRVVAASRPADQTRISEAMTPEVFWCYEDEDIGDVLDKMGDRQVRRIPVVSRDKQLVGIVSLGDMATQRSGTQVESALEDISEPSQSRH